MNLKELFETSTEDMGVSRRQMLQKAAMGSVLVAAGGLLAGCAGEGTNSNSGGGSGLSDADVLNFALNLEYLEAEFYAFAVNGASGLTQNDITGVGTAGVTQGGSQVALSGLVRDIANEIRADEIAHVRFLRTALGGAAVAKPRINLGALGIGFANEAQFLALARAFEDVGVSAYAGAARLIQNKDFLEAAAQILATEALHTGNIRLVVVQQGVTSPAQDAKDQPPTANNFFATDANALAIKRSPREVLDIVYAGGQGSGGFFPNGFNGAVKS